MSITKKVMSILAALALMFSLSACKSNEAVEREKVQEAKKSAAKTSLDKQNLERKDAIESKPTQVGYVYLMSFAQPIGYYVIKGKVSSSGGQLTPEQDIICTYNTSESCQAVDGPFDDGTYGEREPGIFFFTAEGAMVHTSLDYIYSTEPLPVNVPKLSGK